MPEDSYNQYLRLVENNEYNYIITFIKELERLKDITRTAWTKSGRRESVAEHSWRLAVFALVLEDCFTDIDFNRVIRMCLLHDLGEAYEGDVSAKIEVNQEYKLKIEGEALSLLLAPLSECMRDKLISLWREYNNGVTKEAKVAKALDKIETIIQHNQGSNPIDFDYEFNLGYGKKYTSEDPIIRTIREIVDRETSNKVNMKQKV